MIADGGSQTSVYDYEMVVTVWHIDEFVAGLVLSVRSDVLKALWREQTSLRGKHSQARGRVKAHSITKKSLGAPLSSDRCSAFAPLAG